MRERGNQVNETYTERQTDGHQSGIWQRVR